MWTGVHVTLAPGDQFGRRQIRTAVTHLRDVLGDQTYESLARKGETMTPAEMATYAYDQTFRLRSAPPGTEHGPEVTLGLLGGGQVPRQLP